MTDTQSSGVASRFDRAGLRDLLTSWPSIALASGLLAGMGSFMFVNPAYAPLSKELSGLLVALGGAVPAVYAASLRASIHTAILGYLVAASVYVLASIGPWFLLSFSPEAVEVLAYTELGLIVGNAFFTVFLVYFIGYLTVVFLIGTVHPSA